MTLGQYRAGIVRVITVSVSGLGNWWGYSCGAYKEIVLGEVN